MIEHVTVTSGTGWYRSV